MTSKLSLFIKNGSSTTFFVDVRNFHMLDYYIITIIAIAPVHNGKYDYYGIKSTYFLTFPTHVFYGCNITSAYLYN